MKKNNSSRDTSAWTGLAVMLIFIALFLFATKSRAQSGNFFEINGEYGEAALHVYGHSELAVCHNGHRWMEKIDSTSSENPKFLEVFTGYARWELWYDQKESGIYNKNVIREAWCYQPIGDAIHYHE